jgi:hypothetical protein
MVETLAKSGNWVKGSLRRPEQSPSPNTLAEDKHAHNHHLPPFFYCLAQEMVLERRDDETNTRVDMAIVHMSFFKVGHINAV